MLGPWSRRARRSEFRARQAPKRWPRSWRTNPRPRPFVSTALCTPGRVRWIEILSVAMQKRHFFVINTINNPDLVGCKAENKHVTYCPGNDEVARHRSLSLNICRIFVRSWKKIQPFKRIFLKYFTQCNSSRTPLTCRAGPVLARALAGFAVANLIQSQDSEGVVDIRGEA